MINLELKKKQPPPLQGPPGQQKPLNVYYLNQGGYTGWLSFDYTINEDGQKKAMHFDGPGVLAGQAWSWKLPPTAMGDVTVTLHNTRDFDRVTYPAQIEDSYLCVKTWGIIGFEGKTHFLSNKCNF